MEAVFLLLGASIDAGSEANPSIDPLATSSPSISAPLSAAGGGVMNLGVLAGVVCETIGSASIHSNSPDDCVSATPAPPAPTFGPASTLPPTASPVPAVIPAP